METNEFDFELPDNLIAQYPPEKRGMSKLMILDRATGTRSHKMVSDLPDILKNEKPLLVFNDTKVRKARITGKSKETGIEEEFLLLENIAGNSWKAMAKRTKRKKIKNVYYFSDTRAEIIDFMDEYIVLDFDRILNDDWFEKNGHVPLPPYIKRKDTAKDSDRYQTIYAREPGSVAAPTAGLHFTEEILNKFTEYGIDRAYITLHVGLGTFLPVRSKNIEEHKMHCEQFFITDENANKIETAKKENRKILAVGTTSLRTLESAYENRYIKRGGQSTSIFIYPGYKFKITDLLFTNFHTPLSTLLMLVSAFAGKDLIMESYKEAVKNKYRFFSYGDAMLIS